MLSATTAYALVTGIATVADGAYNTIFYTLGTESFAGTLTSTSKTITFTLCAM